MNTLKEIVEIVANEFGVPPETLFSEGWKEVPHSEARQVAMYCCHIFLHLNHKAIGQAFKRGESSAKQACNSVVYCMLHRPAFMRKVNHCKNSIECLITSS